MSDADVPQGINEPPDAAAFAEDPPPRKPPRRALSEPTALSITSLMDVMTIILVFLIKSFSTNPVTLKEARDLRMPFSTATDEPPNATAVLVTARAVIVEDATCVLLDEGVAPDAALSQQGMMIDPCFDALRDEAEHQKHMAKRRGAGDAGFEGAVVFMVDRDVPYELVAKVMYTAGQAEFGKFRFAVVKAGKG